MSNIVVEFPSGDKDYKTGETINYLNEMNSIKKSLSQYPGHQAVASSLGKYLPQEIVAGLIGCIILESGSNHTILNRTEYEGRGASGTQGWNCGEGLIQWTYWKYKLPLIKQYNADSRSTQKLPTTWEQYKRGVPRSGKGYLYAAQDGQHIAGLSMDNQMLFLTIYYNKLINDLKGETNLAKIVAYIYQQKAGTGFYKDIKNNPIKKAYTTSKYKYKSSAGNHYLQSVKIAQEYLNCPVTPGEIQPTEGDTVYYDPNSTLVTNERHEPITPIEVKSLNEGKKTRNVIGTVLGAYMKQK